MQTVLIPSKATATATTPLGLSTKKQMVTPERQELKNRYWHPLRERMRHYIKKEGKYAAQAMADSIGTSASQIHRYTCPVCEHDAEPRFSTAMAIHVFLTAYESGAIFPVQEQKAKQSKTRHRKGCTHEMRNRARIERERKLLRNAVLKMTN